MIPLNVSLSHYKRREVQEEITENAKDREVVAKFNDNFGKRPDILRHASDILELAKQGATSFHASEELWKNPLQLDTSMKRQELDNLRKGWDLVIDIDCAVFDYSKIAADLVVKALKFHKVKSISCKFSVSGDTPVLIKNNDCIKLVSIKEAISIFKKNNEIKVLSLDKNRNLRFSKIYGFVEHRDIIYKLYHSLSKLPIKITKHHSIFVWQDGFIRVKKVSDVKKGDFLISFHSSQKIKKIKRNFGYSYSYNKKTVNRVINITKGFMRLLGYYLSEGHLTKSIHQVGFSFNIEEKEYIKDCKNLIRKCLNKKLKISERMPNKGSLQLILYSKEFYNLFYQLCNKGKNKCLPNFVWALPMGYINQLLLGYIRGDGYKKGPYHIAIKSVSKKLITELIWLCKINGISCNLYSEKNKPHFLSQGALVKGGRIYTIIIPKSDLNLKEFKISRNKFSAFPQDKVYPVDGLRKVYYQIKPKMFNSHRNEQVTLYKKLANIVRIEKVIKWFEKNKLIDFNEDSKRIVKNYKNLSKTDISICRVKKVVKFKKEKVYDLSVEKTESFFGNHYPILLHNSGNRGFHIGVPSEAFPEKARGSEIKNMFPDAPKKIALYIKHMIIEEFGKRILEFEKNDFNSILEKTGKKSSEVLKKEGSLNFNTDSILQMDTLLISPRHLYRMPYSLHEKSGLVSTPLNPEKVLLFRKEFALPKNVRISQHRFLDRSNAEKDEAKRLFIEAFDFHAKDVGFAEKTYEKKDFEVVKTALAEELFPPCIKHILNGLQDGRKRALFILVNYFTSIGWDYDMIEKRLKEWNAKNSEPLREVYLLGQTRYHKQQQKKVLPPNCPKREGNIPLYNQQNYYTDLRICNPDNFCARIKNPAQYTIKKSSMIDKGRKIKQRAD